MFYDFRYLEISTVRDDLGNEGCLSSVQYLAMGPGFFIKILRVESIWIRVESTVLSTRNRGG